MFGPHELYLTSYGLSDFTGKQSGQKKKLPAIVSSIKVRTRTRLGLCGDFEGAIYVDLAGQTGLLHQPVKAFAICNRGRIVDLMRYLRMLKAPGCV